MALTKLGNYIEQYDLRNIDDKYGEDDVVGISTQKTMIKTKADLMGVKLSSYKLVPPKHFAYVSDTSRRGDKMSLCYNDTENTYIVSSISTVFYVNDTENLSSEYLFMYFNRPEFDRYSRFNSWGSARETFDWADMCDIDIDLPPLSIQQKYVDVYNAMLENQKSYERGLDDLKLVCDGYFDSAKKKRTVKLGKIIDKVDERNSDRKYDVMNVRGINNNKQFAETKADVENTDLSKFIVVRKNSFAYNSRTDGRDMLVLALNREDEPIIVTWNYNAFCIKKEKITEVNPEYLYAFFKRSEFDRLIRFISWGSSQELLTWDNLCDIDVPMPAIKEQNSIADINKVYIQRKAINEQIKEYIKNACPILIKGSIEEARRNVNVHTAV